MLLIPAIDIIAGRCVRLVQGDYNRATNYGDDLHAIAQSWADAGAGRIHLVDLEGAKSGQPVNHKAIIGLARAFPDVVFQVGGGVRTMAHARLYLEQGPGFVILGSVAFRQPQLALEMMHAWPGKMLLGVDTRDGKVKISGWLEEASGSLAQLLEPFCSAQLAGVVHTDISRDGMLGGSNLSASAALAGNVPWPVFASGGMGGMQDVRQLCEYRGKLAGAITGRALYEGRLDLARAIALLAMGNAQ